MDKLIYKGTMNDYRTFAEAGITEGSYNERAMQYFKYLGATADSFNEAYRQAMAIGPVLFTPLQLFANGEQGAWYDPSDLSTLYQDAAGTTPVTADGDPVGLMLDKSGNGNHASQAVSAARPTYRTDGTLHWLEFDGVDDFTQSTSFTTSGGGLLFADAGMVAAGTSKTNYGPLDTLSSRNGYTLYNYNGSNATRVFLNGAGRVFSQDPVGVKLINSWRTDNGTALFSLRSNGVVMLSGAVGTSSSQINGAMMMGKTIQGGSETPWSFYGRVIRGDVTSDEENAKVEAYLANLAGVTL